jgi:predicted transcriptional regulator
MTSQSVTIELPELVLHQLARMAEALHQPIELLIAQSVLSNLPPSIEAAPLEL